MSRRLLVGVVHQPGFPDGSNTHRLTRTELKDRIKKMQGLVVLDEHTNKTEVNSSGGNIKAALQRRMVGQVIRTRLNESGEAEVLIQMAEDERGDAVFKRVQSGDMRGLSLGLGYRYKEPEKFTVAEKHILECTVVPVGAEPGTIIKGFMDTNDAEFKTLRDTHIAKDDVNNQNNTQAPIDPRKLESVVKFIDSLAQFTQDSPPLTVVTASDMSDNTPQTADTQMQERASASASPSSQQQPQQQQQQHSTSMDTSGSGSSGPSDADIEKRVTALFMKLKDQEQQKTQQSQQPARMTQASMQENFGGVQQDGSMKHIQGSGGAPSNYSQEEFYGAMQRMMEEDRARKEAGRLQEQHRNLQKQIEQKQRMEMPQKTHQTYEEINAMRAEQKEIKETMQKQMDILLGLQKMQSDMETQRVASKMAQEQSSSDKMDTDEPSRKRGNEAEAEPSDDMDERIAKIRREERERAISMMRSGLETLPESMRTGENREVVDAHIKKLHEMLDTSTPMAVSVNSRAGDNTMSNMDNNMEVQKLRSEIESMKQMLGNKPESNQELVPGTGWKNNEDFFKEVQGNIEQRYGKAFVPAENGFPDMPPTWDQFKASLSMDLAEKEAGGYIEREYGNVMKSALENSAPIKTFMTNPNINPYEYSQKKMAMMEDRAIYAGLGSAEACSVKTFDMNDQAVREQLQREHIQAGI